MGDADGCWMTCPGVTRVRIVWRLRMWLCGDADGPRKSFIEQVPGLVGPCGSITSRSIAWAITQLGREHATIAGLARLLGASWKTVRRAVEPALAKIAADETRFDGVATLGIDEHVWHHLDPRNRARRN
ncbi:hypothetical protein JT358_09260 [Micrococcales bacterium 31B]|nr:hypothetical protein [Micrococcales bacterium 31B]